jgi:nicotinate phosphoribosyltransferase
MSESSALYTDLYQISMAQGYFNSGRKNLLAAFCLYFRRNPFKGGFTIAAGIEDALSYAKNFRFTREDIDYLMELTGNDGAPLYTSAFLKYLRDLEIGKGLEIEAVAEGRVVFPNTPLVRVTGPIISCQLLETALLNKVGFASLVATKTARVVMAAGKASVLEFGLRRAQGDGGMVASRSAYLAGAVGTSNVLAGQRYGIPVKGTHAHSFVMSYDSELEAFEAYAEASRNNLTLLVDTYNTAEGIRNAIKVFKTLKPGTPGAIRLDSGDLANLSKAARTALDAAGLSWVKIVASNDLDEYRISELSAAKAPIDSYGVGTMLATAYDQPALGCVYKLTALREKGVWRDRVKLSEEVAKTSTPGVLQVRRMYDAQNGQMVGDMVYDATGGIRGGNTMICDDHEVTIAGWQVGENLLAPRGPNGSLEAARTRCQKDLGQLAAGVKRLDRPDVYPVGLEPNLHENRLRAIERVRANHVEVEKNTAA